MPGFQGDSTGLAGSKIQSAALCPWDGVVASQAWGGLPSRAMGLSVVHGRQS